jgi:acyl carrier protein
VDLNGIDKLTDWLAERVAYYLDAPQELIDRSQPFAQYGFDSVYALTLCGDIEDRLGVLIEPTVMWDHDSVDALAAYLEREAVA